MLTSILSPMVLAFLLGHHCFTHQKRSKVSRLALPIAYDLFIDRHWYEGRLQIIARYFFRSISTRDGGHRAMLLHPTMDILAHAQGRKI